MCASMRDKPGRRVNALEGKRMRTWLLRENRKQVPLRV